MKQSEKDKIFELIENCKTGDIVLGRENYSVIDMTLLYKYIENLPIEVEEITEVYAIKNCITGVVYWNAHGCPYKHKEDAEKKIKVLMREIEPSVGNGSFLHHKEQLPHKEYGQTRLFQLLTFKLEV